MNILALTPPGRFPTVVSDPGQWWDRVSFSKDHKQVRFSANAAWWQIICSASAPDALLAGLSWSQSLRLRTQWRAAGLDIRRTCALADKSLDALRDPDTYRSICAYKQAIELLDEHLRALNKAQRSIRFSFEAGPLAAGVDYNDSSSMLAYARKDTLLSRLILSALDHCHDKIDLLIVSATSAQDLLCAMICVRLLREKNPLMHACLGDHGYENFSLQPHLAALRGTGALSRVFDTIIESKDERDDVIVSLIRSLSANNDIKGFLRSAQFPKIEKPFQYGPPAPPVPAFTPYPVFWTRLSKRRCYWSKCAFCAQNNKYDDPRPASLQEVSHAISRLERLYKAGYRNFYFSDEAVSPAWLDLFCQELEKKTLKFKWACRSKVETSFTPELLTRLRASGCYELLFGLETISARMQQRMNKYVAGLDARCIREMFFAAGRAGVGTHVNLLAGFPGDTPSEARETVDFVIETLKRVENSTFILNKFVLFPDTPVLRTPEKYDITPLPSKGDMPSHYGFEPAPEIKEDMLAVDRLIPSLRKRLYCELGWNDLITGSVQDTLLSFYFNTGHGAIFKAMDCNPFADPSKTAYISATLEGDRFPCL
ncbi:B12-binding domain-containing radical SAM protein [Elusimicrobiota bacterium]